MTTLVFYAILQKMIEAHRKNSTFRVTARAGVAKRKGLGAEELGGRDRGSGNSEKIRFAVDRLGRSAISTVPLRESVG